MSSKQVLRDSQRKGALEKMIRSNALSSENKIITEYLKLRFEDIITKWTVGIEQADPERLRGEAACLKGLIQILSNETQFSVFKGDN